MSLKLVPGTELQYWSADDGVSGSYRFRLTTLSSDDGVAFDWWLDEGEEKGAIRYTPADLAASVDVAYSARGFFGPMANLPYSNGAIAEEKIGPMFLAPQSWWRAAKAEKALVFERGDWNIGEEKFLFKGRRSISVLVDGTPAPINVFDFECRTIKLIDVAAIQFIDDPKWPLMTALTLKGKYSDLGNILAQIGTKGLTKPLPRDASPFK
jgi:hypothetical protein